AAIPAARRAHGCGGIPAALALSPRADGPAHDRREGRHRRLLRLRVPERDRGPPPHLQRPVPALPLPHSALRIATAATGAARAHGFCLRGSEQAVSLDLRAHFSIFREAAPGRIHLAAHSHHYWPDVAVQAHQQTVADAARLADRKWDPIFEALIPNL